MKWAVFSLWLKTELQYTKREPQYAALFALLKKSYLTFTFTAFPLTITMKIPCKLPFCVVTS